MYYVYRIEVNKKIRYVGYTNNIIIREKQHNYLCFNKNKKKDLYNKIRQIHPNIKELKLNTIRTFTTKVEAKRFECLLILNDHFGSRELWQRVPRITDV